MMNSGELQDPSTTLHYHHHRHALDTTPLPQHRSSWFRWPCRSSVHPPPCNTRDNITIMYPLVCHRLFDCTVLLNLVNGLSLLTVSLGGWLLGCFLLLFGIGTLDFFFSLSFFSFFIMLFYGGLFCGWFLFYIFCFVVWYWHPGYIFFFRIVIVAFFSFSLFFQLMVVCLVVGNCSAFIICS